MVVFIRIAALTLVNVCTLLSCARVDVTDFADWPVDSVGYEIEEVPVNLAASFVRDSHVYFGRDDGVILQADDRDLSEPWKTLGQPYTAGPRLLFVSSKGVLFVSPNNLPLVRSEDGGHTWNTCLNVPVWRMDEDDQGNLYAGNYNKVEEQAATLYKSNDGGITWHIIFEEFTNHHIHTVRWDDQAKRLYIAFGDGPTRGQAYSGDRGGTFIILDAGHGEGHTDVAFTDDYVFWASDDQSGRVFRVDRKTGVKKTMMGMSQFMWFAVGDRDQVYIGTMTSQKTGGERAALLASADQGETWQKLMETVQSRGAYDQGFVAESRNLSAGGWLYCWGGGVSYRIRRTLGTNARDSSLGGRDFALATDSSWLLSSRPQGSQD